MSECGAEEREARDIALQSWRKVDAREKVLVRRSATLYAVTCSSRVPVLPRVVKDEGHPFVWWSKANCFQETLNEIGIHDEETIGRVPSSGFGSPRGESEQWVVVSK